MIGRAVEFVVLKIVPALAGGLAVAQLFIGHLGVAVVLVCFASVFIFCDAHVTAERKALKGEKPR